MHIVKYINTTVTNTTPIHTTSTEILSLMNYVIMSLIVYGAVMTISVLIDYYFFKKKLELLRRTPNLVTVIDKLATILDTYRELLKEQEPTTSYHHVEYHMRMKHRIRTYMFLIIISIILLTILQILVSAITR